MKYKHLSHITVKAASGGERPQYFIKGENQPLNIIESFYNYLVSKGRVYSHNTINRYLPAVAHFYDYIEEFVISRNVTNPAELSKAVFNYKLLCLNHIAHNQELTKWKTEIEFPDYAKNSLLPIFGALNTFINYLEAEVDLDIYIADKLGAIYTTESPIKIIKEFKHKTRSTIHVQNKIRSVSWLAGCIRSWQFVERNKSFSPFVSRRVTNNQDEGDLNFPIGTLPLRPNESKPRTYFESVLEHTRTYRDKAIFILLAWAGLRTHECLNILIFDIRPDILPTEGRIKIISPYGRKEAQTDGRPLPSKGRKNQIAIMPPHWEIIFFEYLKLYLEQEYIYNSGHNFLFHNLKGNNKGAPLAYSQSQVTKNLKNAIIRARNNGDEIPGKRIDPDYLWCDHSLRHHYGKWMRNFQPTGLDQNGNILKGFSLTQVQDLMGHDDQKTTKLYAQYETANIIKTLSTVDVEWNS
jgi:integrase